MNELVKLKKRIEIKKWLDEKGVTDYTINGDLTVDVIGTLSLIGKKVEVIPLQFRNVSSHFWCEDNILRSTKGFPTFVGETFDCHFNYLNSLEGCPKKPRQIQSNPCSPIYYKLGWTEEAHIQCRKVWI